MKLTAPLLALTLAVSVSAHAQTTTAKPAAKSATATKSAAPAAKPATAGAVKPGAAAVHMTPNGPSNIPVVHGIKKPLYTLSYIDTQIGSGPLAQPSVLTQKQADAKIMWYTVHYTGWLAKDGTKFDSSYDHPGGSPITFPYGLGKVIPGWDTAFEGMHVGGKRRIFVPYQLAYGAGGRPPVIPGKSDLIFDVELISVSDKAPAPPTPPAAAVPPPSTTKPGNVPPVMPTPSNPKGAGTPPPIPPDAPAPGTTKPVINQ